MRVDGMAEGGWRMGDKINPGFPINPAHIALQ